MLIVFIMGGCTACVGTAETILLINIRVRARSVDSCRKGGWMCLLFHFIVTVAYAWPAAYAAGAATDFSFLVLR